MTRSCSADGTRARDAGAAIRSSRSHRGPTRRNDLRPRGCRLERSDTRARLHRAENSASRALRTRPVGFTRRRAMTRLLTVEEVADRLGVRKQWVWAEARAGRIHACASGDTGAFARRHLRLGSGTVKPWDLDPTRRRCEVFDGAKRRSSVARCAAADCVFRGE